MDKHIRKIFSVFCLVMLGILIWRVRGGIWTPVNWAMFAIPCVCCLLVFRNFVYIFNFSYSLCVLLNSLLLMVVMPSPVVVMMAGVSMLYGLRLFIFTWNRTRSASYADKAKAIQSASDYMPVGIKVALWIQCSLLHTFHAMALYFVAGKAVITPMVLAGVAIMLAGVVIEGVADHQKQQSKAVSPGAFIATGLWARWRHPNFMGEILFHAGIIVAGIAASSSWNDMLVVSIAPLYIVLLMISEAQKYDAMHAEKYGESETYGAEYQKYRANSGSLVPRW